MPSVSPALASVVEELIRDLTVSYQAAGQDRSCTIRPFHWGPAAFKGSSPWAVVQLPGIERTALDEPESQVGADDWLLTFPVVLYFELTGDPEVCQEQAIAVVEAFIAAVDADPTLGGRCLEARVTSAGPPEIEDDQPRVLLVYQCDLEIDKKVSTV